jgi:hypothetical protein
VLKVPELIVQLPFTVVAAPRVTVEAAELIVRLLYVAISVASVIPPCTRTVPAPGTKPDPATHPFVEEITSVPPAVILMELEPPTADVTPVTVSVVPALKVSVPGNGFPILRLPYERFVPTSYVHELLILIWSPAPGSEFPLHFVASEKFPGPVNVLLAPKAPTAQRLVARANVKTNDLMKSLC